ncbi:hypothetical protein ALP75_205594 [Pseudomonas syringae pv. actinidiae]|nr:hypothetical protein ALP75_205594 [Pseudomonas syringae pv. actinidiae]
MQPKTFGDLLADAHQRVQMAAGVLKNHADPASAHGAHPGGIELEQVNVI